MDTAGSVECDERPQEGATKSGLKIETFGSGHPRKNQGVFAYEHPWMARFCHWVNAISLFVPIGSGWRIFRCCAFPSFGPVAFPNAF